MWKGSNQEGLFIEMGTNITHKCNLTIYVRLYFFSIFILSRQTGKLDGFVFNMCLIFNYLCHITKMFYHGINVYY